MVLWRVVFSPSPEAATQVCCGSVKACRPPELCVHQRALQGPTSLTAPGMQPRTLGTVGGGVAATKTQHLALKSTVPLLPAT